MAQALHKYTVQEKLNKMDVEVFEFTPTTYAGAVGDNDIIFADHEIENSVMIDGGRGIIQSIVILDDDDNGAAMDIFFHARSGAIGSEGAAISITTAGLIASIKAVVPFTTYSDGINWVFGHKENIGAGFKTTDASKSIFVTAVNRSGGSKTYTASGLVVKIAIVRD